VSTRSLISQTPRRLETNRTATRCRGITILLYNTIIFELCRLIVINFEQQESITIPFTSIFFLEISKRKLSSILYCRKFTSLLAYYMYIIQNNSQAFIYRKLVTNTSGKIYFFCFLTDGF